MKKQIPVKEAVGQRLEAVLLGVMDDYALLVFERNFALLTSTAGYEHDHWIEDEDLLTQQQLLGAFSDEVLVRVGVATEAELEVLRADEKEKARRAEEARAKRCEEREREELARLQKKYGSG